MLNLGFSTRNVAFLAIFIALSVIVIRFVPGIPIVGVPDSQIKFDAAIAPIYGMIIGPYLGFLAALIGGLLTSGSPFTFLTSFAPAISAMVAGFLTQQKITDKIEIPGWIAAVTILGVLIVGWYSTWVGRQAPFYPILHLAGFFAILITRKWTAKSFEQIGLKKEKWQLKSNYILLGIIMIACAYLFSKPYVSEFSWLLPYFSLPLHIIAAILILYGIFGRGKYSFVSSTFLASYCGIISDHMLGNIIFIQVIDIFIPLEYIQDLLNSLGLPDIPSLFMYMIPASAAERIIMTIIASIFAVGLLMALFRAGLLSKRGE
ncbi:MAG: ECF transporter S component [Candidatus Bathyarchaeota archaeon]|jgi:uncharacterized membrane protein